jgi:hypothetical protein
MLPPLPLSGQQVEIFHGDQQAVVVKVGGGLRSYSAGGRDVLDGYGLVGWEGWTVDEWEPDRVVMEHVLHPRPGYPPGPGPGRPVGRRRLRLPHGLQRQPPA